MSNSFFESLRGRKVLVTGHTGFTGSWASLWLNCLGCKVGGYALPPNTTPSLYHSIFGDDASDFFDLNVLDHIEKFDTFNNAVQEFQPELILHLAAQPLVIEAYNNPYNTFTANTLGTLNVLESARLNNCVKAVLCITTDKVYENKEWHWPYRETDELGGKDPYSASKSSAELIVRSYAETFGSDELQIVSARGGNIIGGGDWAENRIIPDFVRSISSNEELVLRSPRAIRPWQHVLCLVHGYLSLLSRMLDQKDNKISGAWNFGPSPEEIFTVKDVVDIMADRWKVPQLTINENPSYRESMILRVDSSKAHNVIGWTPAFNTYESIAKTAEWYKGFYEDSSRALALTQQQIDEYENMLSQTMSNNYKFKSNDSIEGAFL